MDGQRGSHLFYQSRQRRPRPARAARGVRARGGPRLPPAGIFEARRNMDARPCFLLAGNIPGVWGLAPNGEA